jgi:hypothetical protein
VRTESYFSQEKKSISFKDSTKRQLFETDDKGGFDIFKNKFSYTVKTLYCEDYRNHLKAFTKRRCLTYGLVSNEEKVHVPFYITPR